MARRAVAHRGEGLPQTLALRVLPGEADITVDPVLVDTRRKLYGILADGDEATTADADED